MNAHLKTALSDLFFIGVISAVATFFISFYFQAHYLNIGYSDWMVQAFRVKLLAEQGPISWTHIWSNGINIWQTYQFIPHVLTLGLSKLLNVDVPRAMVLWTIIIFILVRLQVYFYLRLSHFSPIASFFASILTFTIAHYWSGVSDYSLQFATLLFPTMIFLWSQYIKGRIRFIFPFLVGICMYVHPILAFFSGLLWLISLFISYKKVVSLQTVVESGLMAVGAALFFYPFIFRSSYIFSNPYLQSLSFSSQALKGYSTLGLSIFLLVVFFIVIVRTLKPMPREYRWMKLLGVFSVVSLFTIFLSGLIKLPFFLAAFQVSRGVALVGTAIAFSSAVLIEDIRKKNMAVIKIVVGVFVFLILVNGMWTISMYAPPSIQNIHDPVTAYIKQYPDATNERLFSPALHNTSYFGPNTIRLPYSYMSQFDSNPVSPRLNTLTVYSSYGGLSEVPLSSMQRIDEYFQVSATNLIFFNEFSPFTKAMLDPSYSLKYEDVATVKLDDSIYHVFRAPWKPVNAALIDPNLVPALAHFPFDVKFADNNDFSELDQYIHTFAETIYSEKNRTLDVAYPTSESLVIEVPALRGSSNLYIAESYSKDWHATFNNRPIVLQPVGPNYMMAILPNLTEGGTVSLQHTWPTAMPYLVVVILVTPFLIGLFNVGVLLYHKVKKTKKE